MTRPLPVLPVAVALAALAPTAAPAAAPTFPQGVAAGDAGTTGVHLWTRAARPGRLTLLVSARSDLRGPVVRRTVTARAANAGAVTATVRGLRPGRRYFFAFARGSHRSATGRFLTAPPTRSEKTVRFAVAGGFAPVRDPSLGVATRIARERNDFNVLLGDTVSSGDASTLTAKRAEYARLLTQRPMAGLRAAAGLYATWGAGEFAPAFAPSTPAARRLYRAGARAFQESVPVVSHSKTGLYRTVRWGRAVELFILDERSFRSAVAAGPECTNPQTGGIDVAPTLPQAVRDSYAGYYGPQLGAPVAPACMSKLRSGRRTMLGAAQLRALRHDLARSTARFTVVISEASFNQLYFLPYDRWEGYEAERQRVLADLRDAADNAVILSAGGAGGVGGEARLQTLEPAGVSTTGFRDVGIGPAAAPTFFESLEHEIGGGTGDVTSRLFFHRAPPYGVGMSCAATKVLQYAEVEVVRSHLTIELRGADGKPVLDADGTRCAPFRLTADTFTRKPAGEG